MYRANQDLVDLLKDWDFIEITDAPSFYTDDIWTYNRRFEYYDDNHLLITLYSNWFISITYRGEDVYCSYELPTYIFLRVMKWVDAPKNKRAKFGGIYFFVNKDTV